MNKKTTVYFLALLAGTIAATISFFAPFLPYGVDSASYIEQARSLMEKGVFEITPYGTDETEVSIPEKLFPPGYSILIAIGSMLLNQPAEVMAPILSLVALLLLPIVIILCFHRIIGLMPALCIGILVVFTPAAVRHGYIAFSDTLSLLLSIFLVNRLLLANNTIGSWFLLGLLTGFSYLLRNANLAFIISVFLFLFWLWVIEPENHKHVFKNTLSWILGNALIIVPWFVRNFLVFGAFQPYAMDPSKVGLKENIHDYIKVLLDTLLSSNELDNTITNNLAGIVLLIIFLVILMYQVVTSWRQWQKIEQKTFFISVAYSVIGGAMVIAARTKYEWGIHIYDRYALPFSCFTFISLFIIYKYATLKINTRYLSAGLVLLLLLARCYELPKFYQYSAYNQSVMGAARQIKNNNDSVCTNLNGRFAVSNYAYSYRILCSAPVRHVFPVFEQNKFIVDGTLQKWVGLRPKQGIVVSLFPYKGVQQNDWPLNQEELFNLKSLGWQVERNEKENLIISHKAAKQLF